MNYRGSTGMGSATVEYLQGKVGDTDVKDCITATQEAIKKYPWLDPDRIGVCGGSHGGLLATHLSGQVPVSETNIMDLYNKFSNLNISCKLYTKQIYSFSIKIYFYFRICTKQQSLEIRQPISPSCLVYRIFQIGKEILNI